MSFAMLQVRTIFSELYNMKQTQDYFAKYLYVAGLEIMKT